MLLLDASNALGIEEEFDFLDTETALCIFEAALERSRPAPSAHRRAPTQ